ncbi:hypothetical protein NMG60_11013659 [Bertholletia excelsa]
MVRKLWIPINNNISSHEGRKDCETRSEQVKDTTDSQVNNDISDQESKRESDTSNMPPKDTCTYWKYLPLNRAAVKGDWESARQIIQEDKEAATAIVNMHGETALHVVVGMGKAIHFVKELVKFMPKEALSMRNNLGQTALFLAAVVGYTEAATILLKEDPSLLYSRDNYGYLPATTAVYARRHTLCHRQQQAPYS